MTGLCGLTAVPATASAAAPPASAAASLTAATSTPDLPRGWTLTSTDSGDRLVWTGPQAGAGDAQVRFFSGDRLLGTPRPARDGRSYRLDVPAGTVGDPSALQVRAGGRRLDAEGIAEQRASGSRVAPVAPGTAALPPVSVDPGKPGKYATVSGEYVLPAVKLPDYPEKVEMRAVVVAPKGATGRHPLALFLHGRHSVCYGGDDEQAWPCPTGTKPIPSYRGYLRAQRLLASQGYVTVSISANGINGQDFASEDGGAQARSSLVRLHLAQWADWSGPGRAGAPAIVRTAPAAAMSQVLLMGHSRGGDGVNRAAIDSLVPPASAVDGYQGPVRWKIRGTLLLAPTLFGHDPAADVPSVVVLPGCDGDVYDLQGQFSVDGTRGLGGGKALHSAAFVVGANHNYFNSEWTPGLAKAPSWDDWFSPGDKVCGEGRTSKRLTPVQQQKVGATYIAAAARMFVKDDDRVLPLLDGSGVRAPSVGKAQVLSHAVGAARTPLVVPTSKLRVTASGTTKAALCREVTQKASQACASSENTVPHFVSFFGVQEEPDRYAVKLSWTRAGGAGAKFRPATAVSLAGSSSVALRVIVPPNSKGTAMDVAVRDSAGRRAVLGRVTLNGLPGTGETVGLWGQEVRVSLKAARRAKLNLRHITQVQLVPRSRTGQAWLLDAWGRRAGTPAVRVTPTARIDVGSLGPVQEGDGPVTYRMPVSVSGNGSGTIRIYVADPTGASTTRLLTVRPGVKQVDVPVRVVGDTAFGYGETYTVLAEAVKGTVVGDFIGNLDVTEDDPAPVITVTPASDQAAEGESLKWRLTLSAKAAVDLYVALPILAPAAGAELATTDLPADWVTDNLYVEPLPSRPLSTVDAGLAVFVTAGDDHVDLAIPTVTDTVTEGPEQIRLQPQLYTGEEQPAPAAQDLLGTVTD